MQLLFAINQKQDKVFDNDQSTYHIVNLRSLGMTKLKNTKRENQINALNIRNIRVQIQAY